MTGISDLFPETYEISRARFLRGLERVRARWPAARLASHPLEEAASAQGEPVSIDWIEADALEEPRKLLVFTLGEHGIEAYVGAAMLALFLEEFLPRLDPRTTGLLILHAINPWGMQHLRRTNGDNVDVNRNFVPSDVALDAEINPDYARIAPVLNPEGPVRTYLGSQLAFLGGLAGALLTSGVRKFRRAVLLGQYRFPQGIYYGGNALQAETQVVKDLYRRHILRYEQAVLLDMHTGYGPRRQMSVVNSALEPRSSEELAQAFAYPLVVKADASEFYSIQGDMIDYVYTLVQGEAPQKRFYATTFEFGTFGDSFGATLRSLRAMILENQVHRFGAASPAARERVSSEFGEMFNPQDAEWRAKALADARQAFEGILRAEGFITAGEKG